MSKGKYESHVQPKLSTIEGWARNGLSLVQIANNLGISFPSLIKYRESHIELLEVLKRGIDEADIEVENSLYKRAMGYRYDEVTLEGGVEKRRVTKEVPPDVTAQIFWLKNRKPAQWRDRLNVDAKMEHSGDVTMREEHTQHIIHELLARDPSLENYLLQRAKAARLTQGSGEEGK